MRKRQFIDVVRQYASRAQAKGKSYAEPVNAVFILMMNQAREEGYSEAELTTLGDWGEAFLIREYGKFDKEWSPTELA